MTSEERLKEIEETHKEWCKTTEDFTYTKDLVWLIARVKKLTEAIEDALSIHNEESKPETCCYMEEVLAEGLKD